METSTLKLNPNSSLTSCLVVEPACFLKPTRFSRSGSYVVSLLTPADLSRRARINHGLNILAAAKSGALTSGSDLLVSHEGETASRVCTDTNQSVRLNSAAAYVG